MKSGLFALFAMCVGFFIISCASGSSTAASSFDISSWVNPNYDPRCSACYNGQVCHAASGQKIHCYGLSTCTSDSGGELACNSNANCSGAGKIYQVNQQQIPTWDSNQCYEFLVHDDSLDESTMGF
jgi:hypothetical protein